MLKSPENFRKYGSEHFEYDLILHPPQQDAEMYKFRNTIDRRLKFSLTAQSREHLQMFVDNMNMRDPEQGWTIGTCIEGVETCISYNHVYCLEALRLIADELETEWEINDKTVSLGKVEYNKDNPLELSYGKGNGLVPGVGRENYDKGHGVEVLHIEGTSRNINYSEYPGGTHEDGSERLKSKELLLPFNQLIGYDGENFFYQGDEIPEGKEVHWYRTDDDGYSIQRADREITNGFEESMDLTHIYPSREGYVGEVKYDQRTGFYDIIDKDIPDNLDYEQYLIAGEDLEITFQTGMLTGKTFKCSYKHKDRRFEIVQQEIDGYSMPCPEGGFEPRAASGDYPGDKYAVFGCMLPAAYICDNPTHTGASWDMLREGVKNLYEKEQQPYTFVGQIDSMWAKRDWANRGGKIRLGGYVSLWDTDFSPEEPVLIRQTMIVQYFHNPYAPEIVLSNDRVGRGNIYSDFLKIDKNEVVADDGIKESINFTKRRFRDVRQTLELLANSQLDFSDPMRPITVATMALLVGDSSLQYRFVENIEEEEPKEVFHNADYDQQERILRIPGGIMQHLTLGVDTLTSSRKSSDYRYWWNVAPFETPEGYLEDFSDVPYYVYIKAPEEGNKAEFYISDKAIAMGPTGGFYYFLYGLLNSEYNGARSFATLYGFSEILPGRLTTNMIVSSDGKTYFDLLKGEIAGRLKFLDGLISGLIGIGNDQGINAGMSGEGNLPESLRLWAGSPLEERNKAPFRVLNDGTVYAEKGIWNGYMRYNFAQVGSGNNNESDAVYDSSLKGFVLRSNVNLVCANEPVTVILPSSLEYVGVMVTLFVPPGFSRQAEHNFLVKPQKDDIWTNISKDGGSKSISFLDGILLQFLGVSNAGECRWVCITPVVDNPKIILA